MEVTALFFRGKGHTYQFSVGFLAHLCDVFVSHPGQCGEKTEQIKKGVIMEKE